jgi:hypothetical protein
MTANQKLLAAIFIAIAWLGSIVLKHFFADLDTAQFNSACFAALVGLGAFHAGSASASGTDAAVSPPAAVPPAPAPAQS